MIVGIDLGTTYSVVATTDDDGRPTVLRNRLDATTTPSAVHFPRAGEAVVGEAAVAAAAVDPDNTVLLVKRDMGREVPLRFHGVDHTPESVSAVLLRGLVADARAAVGRAPDEPVRAVITVPAYFGVAEREATANAGALAGLTVRAVLNEPTAAAIAYGLEQGEDQTVLVYDLGGGTFDATLLRVGPDGVDVVATDGDHDLGGADVDQRLADVLLDRLAAACAPDDDPRDDAAAVAHARTAAEGVKRALSRTTSHTVRLRSRGCSVSVTVERAQVEAIATDLLDATTAVVDRLLAVAPRGFRVDEVLLVGGSTRMPAVAARVAAHLGVTPRLLDPDLAVALGAARRAHRLATGRGAGVASSVLPRSIGVLVRDSHDPTGLREFVQHVLPANSPLPGSRTEPFATILADQRTARIQVFEQAGAVATPEVGDNRRVLDGELVGLDRLPAGSRVDITVSADTDGRLDVVAREPRTGAELRLEACIDGVVDTAATATLGAVTRALAIGG